MNRLFGLILFVLPFHAFAENLSCDALLLKLDGDAPIPGYITGMRITDQTITLIAEQNKEFIYQIDYNASKLNERTYVGKLGNLPIDQTPTTQQVSVVLVKQEDKLNDTDGVLTDTHLDTYVLKNCKPIKGDPKK